MNEAAPKRTSIRDDAINLPNLLTMLRIALIPGVLFLLWEGTPESNFWAAMLYIGTALTDLIDGYLARKWGQISVLGKFLDPLADKLLLVAVYVSLAVLDLAPAWLAATVVLRDLVIGAGAAIFRLRYGPLNGRPTAISKLNTVCQIAYVVVVVAGQAMGGVPDWLVSAATGVVFISTVASGYDYVMTYARRAAAVARGRGAASAGPAE